MLDFLLSLFGCLSNNETGCFLFSTCFSGWFTNKLVDKFWDWDIGLLTLDSVLIFTLTFVVMFCFGFIKFKPSSSSSSKNFNFFVVVFAGLFSILSLEFTWLFGFILNKSFTFTCVFALEEVFGKDDVSWLSLSWRFWLFSSIFVALFFENKSSSSSSSSPNIDFNFLFACSSFSAFSFSCLIIILLSFWYIWVCGCIKLRLEFIWFITGFIWFIIGFIWFIEFSSLFIKFVCKSSFGFWAGNGLLTPPKSLSKFCFMFATLFSGLLLSTFGLFWLLSLDNASSGGFWAFKFCCCCAAFAACNKGLGIIIIFWAWLLISWFCSLDTISLFWLLSCTNCWLGISILFTLFIDICILFIGIPILFIDICILFPLIPKLLLSPPIGLFGPPNNPSGSSSSSSPNILLDKKFATFIPFIPGKGLLFIFIPGILLLFKLDLIKVLFLNIPPKPLSSSSSLAKAGLINSFSSFASNILCVLIGPPIFCCIILWKFSGLFSILLLSANGGGFGTSGFSWPIFTSFFISLVKSSSSSSALTNPTYSFSSKSFVPMIKGSFNPLAPFVIDSIILLVFILAVSSSWLFLFCFCWSLKLMKSMLRWRMLFMMLKWSSLMSWKSAIWGVSSSCKDFSSWSTMCSMNFVPLKVFKLFNELKKSTSIKFRLRFILLRFTDKSLHFCW